MNKSQQQRRTLGLIGARGGSKGLKNKNLLDFGGKALIAWTIESALAAKTIDDVVVSTDSESIREIAIAAGARAPFLRPAELADDTSDINDAILHALDWLRDNENSQYDFVVLLQPTQPLRSADLIDAACTSYFEAYFQDDDQHATLVTVTRAEPKAAYLMRPTSHSKAYIEFVAPRNTISSNRQAMPQYYWPAGALYLAPVAVFRAQRSFYGERTRFFEVDQRSATDIDTAADFEYALSLIGYQR